MPLGACYLPSDMDDRRPGFCPRCDAPLYQGEPDCRYCGGGGSDADFKAVVVLAALVISALGVGWFFIG